MFGREAGGEGAEGESEQQDQNKAGESVPVSLVWALGHVLRPHQGEDHEAHGCACGGWFQGCCPEPVRVEHLGHHAWGWGNSKLSAEIRASGRYHLSTCFLSFRKGEGRRWPEVVQCRVAGMQWGAGLLPLCAPHSPPLVLLTAGGNSILG